VIGSFTCRSPLLRVTETSVRNEYEPMRFEILTAVKVSMLLMAVTLCEYVGSYHTARNQEYEHHHQIWCC
jgi:hypothetical protein